MGLKKMFRLKQAEKIFPAEITKVRSEDLISKSVLHSKELTKEERKNLQELAQDMQLGRESPEQLFRRKGKKIKRIEF